MNAKKWLDEELVRIKSSGERPKLLLHVCCAPCSSAVLEYLAEYFAITVYFYNPNIYPGEEYTHRAQELIRFATEFGPAKGVAVDISDYHPEAFDDAIRGVEHLGEGSERCYRCYRLRLSEAARKAAEEGFEYVTTSLSISPMKNAAWLNEIGGREALKYGIRYLYSDFKKRDGYKRSIALSAEYGLYRQDYCGCVYSQEEAGRRREESKTKAG